MGENEAEWFRMSGEKSKTKANWFSIANRIHSLPINPLLTQLVSNSYKMAVSISLFTKELSTDHSKVSRVVSDTLEVEVVASLSGKVNTRLYSLFTARDNGSRIESGNQSSRDRKGGAGGIWEEREGSSS